jgi:hypothetical protein
LLEPWLTERPSPEPQHAESGSAIEMPAYGANAASSSPFTAGLQRRAADITANYNLLRNDSTREELP